MHLNFFMENTKFFIQIQIGDVYLQQNFAFIVLRTFIHLQTTVGKTYKFPLFAIHSEENFVHFIFIFDKIFMHRAKVIFSTYLFWIFYKLVIAS